MQKCLSGRLPVFADDEVSTWKQPLAVLLNRENLLFAIDGDNALMHLEIISAYG